MPKPLPPEVRAFVESTPWTFAKTYARTWPHEYVVRTPENAEMLVALARHIFDHGIDGRFYSQVRPYHHEGGKVYWSMDETPESTTLINRCDESQTYEARLAARTLPGASPATTERTQTMQGSLLAHLAMSMTSQKENLATEAVAYILNHSAAARGALHRQLEQLLGDLPPLVRTVTQLAVSAESRPDLLLLGEAGQTLGYVEVKLWAALTEAQPVDYVKRLTEAGGGVLVFVAPERRLPTLRVELGERLRRGDIKLDELTDRSMRVGSVRLGLFSWTKLLGGLLDAASNDVGVRSDVEQLAGLVARIEEDAFIPVSRAELDDIEVPRRAIMFADLVEAVVEAAEAKQVVSTKGLKAQHFLYRAGRYVQLPSAGCWIGLDHEMWADHGRTPLWVRFEGDEWCRTNRVRGCLKDWLHVDPPRAYDVDGCIQVPLLVVVGAEQQQVVDDAVRQLRELDAMLVRGGLEPLKSKA